MLWHVVDCRGSRGGLRTARILAQVHPVVCGVTRIWAIPCCGSAECRSLAHRAGNERRFTARGQSTRLQQREYTTTTMQQKVRCPALSGGTQQRQYWQSYSSCAVRERALSSVCGANIITRRVPWNSRGARALPPRGPNGCQAERNRWTTRHRQLELVAHRK